MEKWMKAFEDAVAETWSMRWVILALTIVASLVLAILI